MAANPLCSIPSCGKAIHTKKSGWCSRHYERWRKHGDPLGGHTNRGDARRFFLEVVLPYDGTDCLIWPYSDKQGYGQLREGDRPHTVSRLVCIEVNGPPPHPDDEAAHSCGRGVDGCVTKRHLSWRTPVQNQSDRLRHGTHNRGERHAQAKFTEADIREIRALKGIITQQKIADRFGTTRIYIKKIHARRAWGWLED